MHGRVIVRLPRAEEDKIKEEFEDLDRGRTIRLQHHTDYCSGSGKPLGVTKDELGNLLYGCFRCGRAGNIRLVSFPRLQNFKAKDGGDGNSYRTTVVIPSDSESNAREWSPHAKLWVGRSRVKWDEVENYGIVFSPKWGKVIIPTYHNGELVGYQRRSVDGSEPKYSTVTKNSNAMIWESRRFPDDDSVVLVEDVLSAIVVGRQKNSIALQGVQVTSTLFNVLSKYNKFYIWLDNDNVKVKLQQQKLNNRLSLLGTVKIIKTHQDPKYLTDQEVTKVLDI